MQPAPKPVLDPVEPAVKKTKIASEVVNLGAEPLWAPSPAREMQHRLERNLGGEVLDEGRPSPLARLAIITGVSLALWSAIGTAVFLIIRNLQQ